MKTYHPDPFAHIDISHRDWIRLGMAALSGKAEWEIVEQAIDEWMRRHAEDQCGEPEFSGYQWKSLFLPHGTVLRTVFKGKNHHCRVECDQIVYQGKAVSPSGFVNAVGGVRRNAWKSLWVLLPDSKHWQLADTLRAPPRSPGARRAAHAARPIKMRAAGGLHGAQATPTAPPSPPSQQPAAPSARPLRPSPQVALPASASVRGVRDFGLQLAVPGALRYRWSGSYAGS